MVDLSTDFRIVDGNLDTPSHNGQLILKTVEFREYSLVGCATTVQSNGLKDFDLFNGKLIHDSIQLFVIQIYTYSKLLFSIIRK